MYYLIFNENKTDLWISAFSLNESSEILMNISTVNWRHVLLPYPVKNYRRGADDL